MTKIYEKEWFDIKSSKMPDNVVSQLVDVSFCSNFYAALFRKFKFYDQLPSSYR